MIFNLAQRKSWKSLGFQVYDGGKKGWKQNFSKILVEGTKAFQTV